MNYKISILAIALFFSVGMYANSTCEEGTKVDLTQKGGHVLNGNSGAHRAPASNSLQLDVYFNEENNSLIIYSYQSIPSISICLYDSCKNQVYSSVISVDCEDEVVVSLPILSSGIYNIEIEVNDVIYEGDIRV